MARGKLTPEQAETHPQRSVITRALGPEPNVQVDIIAEPAQAGDLFLVCSDGLTSMVREPNLKPLLVGNGKPLEELGRSLIAAANEAGGRDNITVVLFKLEEVEAPRRAPRRGRPTEAPSTPTSRHGEYDTFTGEAVRRAAPGRQPPAGPHPPHRRGPDRGRRRVGRRRSTSTAPRAPSRSPRCARARSRSRRARTRRRRRDARRRRKRRRRCVTPGRVLVLGCIIGLLAAFWLATRQVYFVGVDETRGQRRDRVPRPAVRPSARDQPLLAGPALGRDAPERARRAAARRSPTTSCAPRTTPRAWSLDARSRDASASERPQPRAAGADPGVAAGDRRVRRDLHPAQRRSSRTSR